MRWSENGRLKSKILPLKGFSIADMNFVGASTHAQDAAVEHQKVVVQARKINLRSVKVATDVDRRKTLKGTLKSNEVCDSPHHHL